MRGVVSVRLAGAHDAAAVAALETALFGPDAWSEGSVLEELTGPRRHALVSCAGDGTVTGYAVTLTAGDVADLQRIAVAPGSWRTGVASALLAGSRVEAARSGADRMLLEVSEANTAARAFYAAEGFAEIDRRPRYYRDGSDALVLAVPLTEEAGRR